MLMGDAMARGMHSCQKYKRIRPLIVIVLPVIATSRITGNGNNYNNDHHQNHNADRITRNSTNSLNVVPELG